MKDSTKEKIKDFLKTLPSDTKISLETYLDYSYKVGGYPQINLVITIQNSKGSYNYNQHNRDSIEWEVVPVGMYWFEKYIIEKCKELDLCDIKTNYNLGIREHKISNVLVSKLV